MCYVAAPTERWATATQRGDPKGRGLPPMARGSKLKDLTLAAALGQFLERTLLPDLRTRVEESPAVQRALADALARERAASRTADDALAYRERTLEQVGAAWLLDCVFVRYLEDRGLVAQRRLAGEGAVDAQERFGAAFPGDRSLGGI